MSITPIIVDDRDASIAYSAGWTQMGSNFELDSTTAGTTIKGVTGQYTFLGTSIAVFGTIPDLISFPNDTVSSYSIDGGPAQNFTGIRKAETQYRVQFYRSSALTSGQHTIRMTNLVDGGALFFDYFEFIPSIAPSSTTSSSLSQSTSSLSSTPFSSTSLSSTDLSSPPSTATSLPIVNKVLIGGIVGGVNIAEMGNPEC
ncbi:hypothetical protein BDQ12DRAFT_140140 [Crucibulum laeve]|uniref:Uncharacterized protein n=1 Tax=Crucibulum laeve TaxID=68775 RepID=A0A5C3LX59_9AGAR|nr:hypothetical protein BDQ12DRAFT_140140 [Crucibulum laeve]